MRMVSGKVVMAAILLSGCVGGNAVTRGGVDQTTLMPGGQAPRLMAAQYNVVGVDVSVLAAGPGTPAEADILAMAREAATQATATMTTGPKVMVGVQINRFAPQALVVARDDISYTLTVRDAVTGMVLDGPTQLGAAAAQDGLAQSLRLALSRDLSVPGTPEILVTHSEIQPSALVMPN